MKPIITVWLAAICVTAAAAQSTTETTRTKTKVKVDGGKEVTVVGCVADNPGGGYMLTNAGGMQYALVGGDDIAKHLGHRIEVKGKATDADHGKVKVESKEKTNRADTTHEKSEMKGVHALSVKSVKMLASSCR